MSSVTGAAMRKTAATKTLAAGDSGRRHKPMTQGSSDGAGEECCAEGTDWGGSADKIAKLSGADTEESDTEEEAETAGGEGGLS